MTARRLALALVLALATAACGGGDSSDGGVSYEAPEETAAYSEPAEIAAVLNANGVDCDLDGEPATTVTGSYSQTCWLPGQTEQLSIDIYKDADQQRGGVEVLETNGWEVVEGDLWTISTERPATATEVAEAMRQGG